MKSLFECNLLTTSALVGVLLLSGSRLAYADDPVADGSSSVAVLTYDLDAPDSTDPASPAPMAQAAAAKPAKVSSSQVKKVVNGQYTVQVDNGWVVYEGATANPTVNFYTTATNGNYQSSGSFKLKPKGSSAAGGVDTAGGLVFAPCPVGSSSGCKLNPNIGTVAGVGLGFGILTAGGAGGNLGGWVSDSSFTAHYTDDIINNAVTGSIAAVAVGTNGSYAVGWSQNQTTFYNHAVVLTLDSTSQTYAPTAQTDLGTLGGPTSAALGISKNGTYVVGYADGVNKKARAAYAAPTDVAWTDLGTVLGTTIPGIGTILKSHALVASDSGFIAGTVDIKETLYAGTPGQVKNADVTVGFRYNVSTGEVVFISVPYGSVEPLAITEAGEVLGNIQIIPQAGQTKSAVKASHPMSFDGTTVTDYGVMTVTGPSGSQRAYGCRVNRPNHLGQLVGSCIASPDTPYGAGGTAFYIDTTVASPSFLDLNATLHARNDAAVKADFPLFNLGTASSIDDLGEITVVGFHTTATTIIRGGFLTNKAGYLS